MPSSKEPYESPHGKHRHQCHACQTVWEHPDTMAGNEPAHKCPKCGAEAWTRYYGPIKPARIRKPKVPLAA